MNFLFVFSKLISLLSFSMFFNSAPIYCATDLGQDWKLELVPEMAPLAFDDELQKPKEKEFDSIILEVLKGWTKNAKMLGLMISNDDISNISFQPLKNGTPIFKKLNFTAIPLKFLGKSKDSKYLVFGSEVEKGIPLVSKSPLIFRRVVVREVFSLAKKKLVRVQVSIRGWVEE
ncbi:MAG: hypothetical protein HQM08_23490 [Candidatus Riflebacteria bacterium]|nr:hypothetical protein [Candidatus Riflebacteria bacterium]